MKGKRGSGELGEQYAISLLKSKGYKIISKNFKNKLGEIDIIALHSDTLVFVEVKTRWSAKFGAPEEAVMTSKLNKIRKMGEIFCLQYPHLPKKLRIDVVAIEVRNDIVREARIIKVT